MVVVLKIICFGIWLMIMLGLLVGSRNGGRALYRKVTLVLEEDDDTEMCIRQAFSNLKPEDRLVIVDKCSKRNIRHEYVINMFLRQNPSIIYGKAGESFA